MLNALSTSRTISSHLTLQSSPAHLPISRTVEISHPQPCPELYTRLMGQTTKHNTLSSRLCHPWPLQHLGLSARLWEHCNTLYRALVRRHRLWSSARMLEIMGSIWYVTTLLYFTGKYHRQISLSENHHHLLADAASMILVAALVLFRLLTFSNSRPSFNRTVGLLLATTLATLFAIDWFLNDLMAQSTLFSILFASTVVAGIVRITILIARVKDERMRKSMGRLGFLGGGESSCTVL